MLRASLLIVFLTASPALAQHPSPSAEDAERIAQRIMVRAMTRSFLGDDEQARALFEQALSYAPSEPSLFAALADLHRRTGDLDQAQFYAERAAALASDRVFFARMPVDVLIDRGRLLEAETELGRLIERFPNDGDLQSAMGDLQMTSERWEAAARTFEAVDRAGPLRVNVLDRLATAYERIGDTESEISTLKRLANLAGHAPGVYRRLGLGYLRMNRSDEAAAAFRRAVAADPLDSESRSFLDRDNRDSAAEPSIEQAERLRANADADPRNVRRWVDAGSAYLALGLPETAGRIADDARLLFPGDMALALLAADALLEGLQPQSAAAAYRLLLDEPDFWPGATSLQWSSARVGLARSEVWLGRVSEGLERLDEPHEDLDAAVWHAWALAESGDPGAARKALTRLPESLSSDLVALYAAGDPDALERRIGAIESPRPWALLLLGDLLAARGRNDEAEVAWTQARGRAPKSTLLADRLGGR